MNIDDIIGLSLKLRVKASELMGVKYTFYAIVGSSYKRLDKAVRATGNSEYRVLLPNCMITADWREDRLNFKGVIRMIDADNAEFIITEAYFG